MTPINGSFAHAGGVWLIRSSRFFAFALAVLTLAASPALPGQTGVGTGTIRGRIFNPATGQYVRDAEIRIEGTERRTFSEEGGQFELANVPAGDARLVILFTGYNTVQATVGVPAGQVVARDFDLISSLAGPGAGDTIKMEALVVSTEREGNAKAIMAQRRNMNISTSVASDIFGDVSEGNVGEFLKFLPGVDVEYQDAETRGPRLGGLSPEYVGVTMDGARMASADALGSYNGFINAPDAGRSMGFEQLSISSIESIEISRTISADMDADSPAGNINMKTKRGFDRKGRRIDWQFSVTGVSDDFKWGKTTRPGDRENHLVRPSAKLDYSDVFMDRRLGASLSVSHSKVLVEQQSVTHTLSRNTTAADPRPLVVTAVAFGDGPKFIDRDTVSLNLDFKASSRLVLAMTTMYNTFSGATFSRSLSFTAANANANVNNGRMHVLGDGLTEIRTDGLAVNNVRAVNIGGGQNFDKKTKTLTFIPKFEYTLNRLLVDGGLTYSKSHNDYQSLPDSIRTHTTDTLTGIDFRATRSDMNSAKWTIVQTAGPDWADLGNYRNPRLQSNEDRGEIVKVYEASINARYTLPLERPTFLKIGAKLNEQYRNSYNRNGADQYSYIGPGGNLVAADGTITPTGSFANFVSPRLEAGRRGPEIALNIPNMPRHPNRQELATAFMAHPEWFRYTATPAQYYDAFYGSHRDFKQAVPAVFGMANTRLGKWQFQAGLRWEKSETTSKQYDPVPAPEVLARGYTIATNRRATTREGIDFQFGSRPRVKRVGDYDNLFPSFSAKYSITSNLQAQFGYSHAISRPPVSALAGVWTINDVNLVVNAPNTNLKPETSNNYVARLAYYFEPVASITLLVQQNEITDIRETFRFTADEFGFGDDPAYEGYEFVSTLNGDRLFRYRNLELGYNQQLSFLPGPFRGTNVSLSYSRSYANLRRPGLIPHKVSGSVAWNYWRVNLRLSGIWQDDAQWTSTVGRFQRHNVKFDLNGGFRLSPRTSLFVQGRNILNEPRTQYDPNPGTDLPPVLQGMFNYGVSWVFGVKGNF
ncbi:MAG: TonB-dependent receptor [Opitutaceae bacterium]|nr:TonB-dependent receptor [Opitutaceae bacterium]